MSSYSRRKEKEQERAAEEERERAIYWDRYNGLYGMPDHAKHEYLMMEDAIGESQARAVLDFMVAMAKPGDIFG